MSIRRLICFIALSCSIHGCSSPNDVLFEVDGRSTSSLDGGGTQFGATIDGVMWNWNVSWNDVEDTPDWEPGQEPAISMTRAIQVAQAEIPKYADTALAYRLDQVEWLPIGACCDPNHSRKWIYLVDFERIERFPSGARGTVRIPVLLDGRAIQGIKEETRSK